MLTQSGTRFCTPTLRPAIRWLYARVPYKQPLFEALRVRRHEDFRQSGLTKIDVERQEPEAGMSYLVCSREVHKTLGL